MTVRTAYPATESAGDILTAANFDKLPGGWIGYAEVTADQLSITTIADLTSLTVTVTTNTSRRIRIRGRVNFEAINGATQAELLIRESSTVQNMSTAILPATGNTVTLYVEAVITPTAASHTYKLSARSNNNGSHMRADGATFTAYTDGGVAFISVEDLGPAS